MIISFVFVDSHYDRLSQFIFNFMITNVSLDQQQQKKITKESIQDINYNFVILEQMKPIPSISKTITILALSTSVLFILIAFLISIPYRKALFDLSLQMIREMQVITQGQFFNAFNNLITLYAGTEGSFVLIVLIYILSYDKINVIVLIIYICINTYFMTFLKVVFLDPRPYIYPQFVHNLQWKCQITYGFPSGHTWILLLLHEPMVTDIFGCGPYKMGLLYSALLAIFVPWSRMYLGSHSADQLINGLLYSFAFLVAYRYYFREQLFKLLGILLNARRSMRNFTILIVIHLVLLIPPLIIYDLNANYRDINMEQFYKTNQICYKDLTYLKKLGMETSDVAIGNIVTGFMYAFLLLKDKYGNDQHSIRTLDFLLGYWEFRGSKIKNFLIKKFLLYSLSILLTAGIIYIFIGMFIQDFYITYLLKVLGLNVMMIIWIRLIPEISVRFKLIQKYPYHKTSMIVVNC